jgi:hypothetical protein
MRNIGHAARFVVNATVNPMMDNPFFHFGEYCHSCQRWYNPQAPHICEEKLLDKITERKKIVRWLGDSLSKVHDK